MLVWLAVVLRIALICCLIWFAGTLIYSAVGIFLKLTGVV
jgi:hypothetical protein